jgi:hypothetical protein
MIFTTQKIPGFQDRAACHADQAQRFYESPPTQRKPLQVRFQAHENLFALLIHVSFIYNLTGGFKDRIKIGSRGGKRAGERKKGRGDGRTRGSGEETRRRGDLGTRRCGETPERKEGLSVERSMLNNETTDDGLGETDHGQRAADNQQPATCKGQK